MRKSIVILTASLMALLFVSCTSTTKLNSFPGMYSEKPVVVLIMPPVNNSTHVEAKDYFYSTLNVPLAEAGYYVLPPATTMATLQRESAYDSELFIDGDISKFGKLFGADLAVFTVIKSWEKSVLVSSVNIEIEYIFKSTKTNEVLYRRDAFITCDTSSSVRLGGMGLMGALINATADAVKTAVTDYVDVAIMCNKVALSDIPAGKYSPKYDADQGETARLEKVRISTSK